MADNDDLLYTVSRNDTVIGIGARLLDDPRDWVKILERNQLSNKSRLKMGSTLRIPRVLLRSQPSQALITSVAGNSQVNGKPAQVGQVLVESDSVDTAADGVVEIKLADGSTLKLAPQSRLRLERLRQFHRDDVIEARSVIEKGRVEARASPNRKKPLEIRTPFATAAVRGTDFRVGAASDLATSEVLSGALDWGQPKAITAPVALAGGFGASGSSKGVTPPEKLLPAPNLAGLPAVVQRANLSEAFAAVSAASAYRIQLSEDPKFASVLQERVSTEARVEYATPRDGRIYLRVRPIAESRVEGFEQNAQIEVRARPFAPQPKPAPNSGILFNQMVALGWNPSELAAGYRLQLAADDSFANVLTEQAVDATSTQVSLAVGEAPRAKRFWRVAGVNAAGGYLGPYSEPQSLRFYAPPAAPRLINSGVERALLGWVKRDGERYALEVANNSNFSPANRIETGDTQRNLTNLSPGIYFARLAAITDDGVTTPYSAGVSFRVKGGLLTGSGVPLESGSGVKIESPDY